MHKAAVPPLTVVAPQPLRGAVYPQYEGLSVGEGLVWVEEGGRGEKKTKKRDTETNPLIRQSLFEDRKMVPPRGVCIFRVPRSVSLL